jgi:hypothetical protein
MRRLTKSRLIDHNMTYFVSDGGAKASSTPSC